MLDGKVFKDARKLPASAGSWPCVLKGIWLINSLSAGLLEANYQLRELARMLPELKEALGSLKPKDAEKVSRVLAQNTRPLRDFSATWGQIEEEWEKFLGRKEG